MPLSIFGYFSVLLDTSGYVWVLFCTLSTLRYFQGTFEYFCVLLGTFKYFWVLLGTFGTFGYFWVILGGFE